MKNWTCPKCGRIFQKEKQVHSCKSFPVENHFKNKPVAEKLYKHLFAQTKKKVGKCKEISLPCCIHWYGKYDFIALLSKKDKLEIRFALDRKVKNSRITQTVPLSRKNYKNCLYISNEKEIDDELIAWLKESYNFKE